MFKKVDTFGLILRDPDPTGSAGGGAASVEVPNEPAVSSSSNTPITWLDSLPEDVKTTIPQEFVKDPNVTKYKDLPEFLKGHVNQSKLIGAKGIIVPKEDASPEEKEKFLNALGRPEKPELYKFTPIQNLNKSIVVTPETQSAFNTIAHKTGLTNKQADELNSWYLNSVNEMINKQEKADLEAAQLAETNLRKEWGDKFDSNKASVVKMLMNVGGQDVLDAMGGPDKLGNNPVVLKALGKISAMLSEDQINSFDKSGSKGSSLGNETKEEAIKKIEAMNSDIKGPLYNDADPKHDEAIAERKRLYAIAYGGGE